MTRRRPGATCSRWSGRRTSGCSRPSRRRTTTPPWGSRVLSPGCEPAARGGWRGPTLRAGAARVALAAAAGLLPLRPRRAGRRRTGRPARPAERPPEPPPAGTAPAGTAVADRAGAPEAPADLLPPAPEAELERPPPSAGR